MPLLEFTERGIYCAKAKVYIDPWKPVDYAIITHAHADHARTGNKFYLCHTDTLPILKHRLGADITVESKKYGEQFQINGVCFSMHPAGHILGSAQIRVEYKGEVWVVSGDYKIEDDGFTVPFEPVKCNVFITECTFGLPVFKWKPQQEIFSEINNWWSKNKEEGKTTLITAYSLGKAQRLLHNIDLSIGKIYAHGAIENTNTVIKNMGIDLPNTTYVDDSLTKKDFAGSLVIAPPGVLGSSWVKSFAKLEIGIASGWMSLRGARRRQSADRGFSISDHCDWQGLNDAIKVTGCEKVITTHGYTSIFTKWLNEQGLEAQIENTAFEGEQVDTD